MRCLGVCLLLLMALPLLASPAYADDEGIEGGLKGFTHTGVLVGNRYIMVEVPFAPGLHDDRAILDTESLQRGVDSDIYIPIVESDTSRIDALTVHYMDHFNVALAPPPPVAPDEPAWVQRLAHRIASLQKLSKKLEKIVNPRIKTKNFDIVIQFMYHP